MSYLLGNEPPRTVGSSVKVVAVQLKQCSCEEYKSAIPVMSVFLKHKVLGSKGVEVL